MNPSLQQKITTGFTLLELLVVTSMVGFLSMMTGPAVYNLATRGKFANSLIQASSALEMAHEYAVANDTYTYVGFTEPDSEGKILVAIFGARDGSSGGISDLNSPAVYEISDARTAGPSSLILLDKLTKLEGTILTDSLPTGNALNNHSELSENASPLPERANGDATQFTYQSNAYGTVNFQRTVQFTPEGMARVSPVTPEAIRIVLIPVKGNPAKPIRDEAAASAISITGITGQVKVYQPGSL